MKKRIFNTSIILLSGAILSTTVLPVVNTFAAVNKNQIDTKTMIDGISSQSSIISDKTNLSDDSFSQNHIQPRGPVTIFVAGIVVAWLADGVIIYATGQPAANWIADAIRKGVNYAKSHKGISSVHVSRNGVVHGGSSGSF